MCDFLRHTGISGLAKFYMELYRKLVCVFSKYLDTCYYCRYQYCANDTLFRNISCILRSIFQDILPKKDVAFCETTDTAHSYIKQADLSLRWTHSHFVGFVMSRLMYRRVASWVLEEPRPPCLTSTSDF